MQTFELFNSFPPEIHHMILNSCPPNDRTCLRLTCSYLYNLSPPKHPLPLSNEDPSPLNSPPCRTCPDALEQPCYIYRSRCHETHLEAANVERRKQCMREIESTKTCKMRRMWRVCECFKGKEMLYQRLRTWVPKGLNYCGTCRMWTRRKRGHGGRCEYASYAAKVFSFTPRGTG